MMVLVTNKHASPMIDKEAVRGPAVNTLVDRVHNFRVDK